MHIYDFENHINQNILDRGFNYYNDGNIKKVYKQRNNKYVFYIEGGDDYEVSVEIGDHGDILNSYCDCPYDLGPICKHEVAAYFKLFEMLDQENDIETAPSKANKRDTIYHVLINLSKQELINIIVDVTTNDDILKNSLLIQYGKGDGQQALVACQEIIDSIAIKYTGREGFITYRNTWRFVSELEGIVEKVRNMENVQIAVDIALLLLEEAIDAFSYADDSNGDIGSLITETLELIEEIVSRDVVISNHKMEIFEKLLAQTDNEVFDGWLEYKIDLLSICFDFVDDENCREQLINKIESMIEEDSNDDYLQYGNEKLLQLLFQLVEDYGTQAEAEQFIHEHLQYSSFREKLLNKYLQDKNYEKVIELAKEGEKQDQDSLRPLSKWKKSRYKALKSLSRKEEQRILAKELFLAGDFDYYQELKELATNNLDEFYTDLKLELKKGKGWYTTRLFLNLIEKENDLEEILEFVKSNPRYIEDYAEKLVNHFEEDAIEIYKKYIEAAASASSNRRDYQRVCQKLKGYKKIAGKQRQVEFKKELKALYRRRPAFIDELGRV